MTEATHWEIGAVKILCRLFAECFQFCPGELVFGLGFRSVASAFWK